MSLLRIWRNDQTLFVLTGLMLIGAWLPLFASPFLPFPDLPNNTGAASLLWSALSGHGVAAAHYKVHLAPIPYWTAYVSIAALRPIFGPLWAAKLVCGVIVGLLPIATMRLLAALGRSPRLGLWAFLLSWEHNLYSGWITFMLGMCFALFALAWLIECKSWRGALPLLGLSVVLSITHIEAVAFFLVAGGLVAIVDDKPFQKVGFYAIGATGSLVALYPWLEGRLKTSLETKPARGLFTFDWHTPAQKIASLHAYTVDNLPGTFGMIATATAFFVLVLGPVVLGSLARGRTIADRGRAIVILVAALGLYLALPMEVSGPIHHWYTYPRYATFILLALLLIPRPKLDGRRAWLLVPGLAAALLLDTAVARQFRAFAANSSPFLRIIDAVPAEASVLPLIEEERDPACKINPYNQFHSYIVATKLGYDPFLFDTADNPLLFRPETRPPAPRSGRVATFSMAKQGRFFDYVLVQGLAADPFAKNAEEAKQVSLVLEAGIWRLYAVRTGRFGQARDASAQSAGNVTSE